MDLFWYFIYQIVGFLGYWINLYSDWNNSWSRMHGQWKYQCQSGIKRQQKWHIADSTEICWLSCYHNLTGTFFVLVLIWKITVPSITKKSPQQKSCQISIYGHPQIWKNKFSLIFCWLVNGTSQQQVAWFLSNYRFSCVLNHLSRWLRQFQAKITGLRSTSRSFWAQKMLKLHRLQVWAWDFFYVELFVCFGVDMTDNGPDYYQKKVPRPNPARFSYMTMLFFGLCADKWMTYHSN